MLGAIDGGGLHQRNHHRRGQDGFTAAAHMFRRVLVFYRDFGRADQAYAQRVRVGHAHRPSPLPSR